MAAEIMVRKPTPEELERLDVRSWSVWEKERSVFPWFYPTEETCYFEEGRVRIKLNNGKVVEVGKGDLVVFPEGLECVWEILEPVTKRYTYS